MKASARACGHSWYKIFFFLFWSLTRKSIFPKYAHKLNKVRYWVILWRIRDKTRYVACAHAWCKLRSNSMCQQKTKLKLPTMIYLLYFSVSYHCYFFLTCNYLWMRYFLTPEIMSCCSFKENYVMLFHFKS